MATERQAKLAREQHQNDLVKSGAHALSVEALAKARKTDRKQFGVVAWVRSRYDKKSAWFPPFLQIRDKGKTISVPLVIRKSEPFQLE